MCVTLLSSFQKSLSPLRSKRQDATQHHVFLSPTHDCQHDVGPTMACSAPDIDPNLPHGAQAAEMEQEIGNSGALSSNKAALLMELLTQKLLALDNVDTQGDQELRQERKAEINKINRLLDHLEAMKSR